MANRKDITFRTIDGLTLHGWLYPSASPTPSPAVILTPGLPCVKEMFIPQVGEFLQLHGITALLYDPRHLGESEGQPRNEIDPALQTSDYSDAVTFLLTQPNVDPKRIALWGMSFSGTIALCAAALDPRVSAVVAAAPYLDLRPPADRIPAVLRQVMRDRVSRTAGNQPTYLPMLSESGRNPAGLHLHPTPEELEMVLTAEARGAVNFRNRCTLETYYRFLSWDWECVVRLLRTPCLIIVPVMDTWSLPEKQMALYDSIVAPKRAHMVERKGHLTLFNGEEFKGLMEMQMEFLREVFDATIV